MYPRSPTATMRLPTRSASTSSSRCMVVAPSGPLSGRTSFATAPPRAAAPRQSAARLARTDATQVGRRVVPRRALQRLVDQLLFAAQSHRDVAARLQVVVDLDRTEEHRDVVPVLVVLLGVAPELAAAVVLVGGDHGPAILVDVERALGVDVARAGLERRLDHPHTMQLV